MAIEVYEWVLSGTLGGQFVQTVQHVRIDIAAPVGPYQTAFAILQSMLGGGELVDLLMDCLPEDYQATSLRVRRVSGTGGPTAIALSGAMATSAGQRSGNISSAQVNPVLIWIPQTLPDKTGRLFMPGVSEDDIEEMALIGALVTAYDAFITYYINDVTITGATYRGCVWRRVLLTGDPILGGYTSPLIGTQRRRLRPV